MVSILKNQKHTIMTEVNVLKYFPVPDKEVVIKTVHGQDRLGYYYGGGCFRFTDCTHPMQNMNCPYQLVVSWHYRYDDIMMVGTQKNCYERQKEGEEILSTIKTPLLVSIKNYLSRLIGIK